MALGMGNLGELKTACRRFVVVLAQYKQKVSHGYPLFMVGDDH
jgi:hypothetical protein